MSIKFLRRASLCATAAALLMGGMAAKAGSLTSEGVTFTVTSVDADTFTLQITNALDGTGSWANIQYLWLLGVKNVGAATGGSVTGQTTTWANLELDASTGCGPGTSTGATCFTWATPMTLSNDFTLTVSLLGGPFDFTSPHIKVGFLCGLTQVRGSYDVCGNLLSMNIPADTDTDTDTDTDVPEPGTLALLSLGLLGLGATRRRKA